MPCRSPAQPLKRLGTNVRACREAQNLSQEELAGKANLDRTYIGGLERGERNATLQTLLCVAAALGTTVSALCKGIDE